jgi:hypothetical protein
MEIGSTLTSQNNMKSPKMQFKNVLRLGSIFLIQQKFTEMERQRFKWAEHLKN